MNRSTSKSGQFNKKRGDSRVGNIEKKYGVDLGVRSDMKLSTYLKKEGFNSLSQVLKKLD